MIAKMQNTPNKIMLCMIMPKSKLDLEDGLSL